jgi:DNA-binding MarR family transcriptional regulator
MAILMCIGFRYDHFWVDRRFWVNGAMSSQGLAYWSAAVAGLGIASEDAYGRMMSHPRFAEACRMTATSTLSRNAADSNVIRLMKDGARATYGVFTLYLDSKGGLTLSTIQKFCDDTGLASPGRSAAIMIQLWMTGYLSRNKDEKDRRISRYKPTAGLEAAIRDIFRDELTALALMEPDAKRVADHLDDDAVFRAYLMEVGKGLEKILRRPTKTDIALFVERNAGLGILYKMALSGEPVDTYPPRLPLIINITDIARQFEVSRSHIHRLLNDAEKRGLLRRNADETSVAFEESLRTEIGRFHAGLYMGSAACALAALKVLDSAQTRQSCD